MPVYEYRCTRCQHLFERYQAVGDPAPACPRCGEETRKVYNSVGLIFKGSGFHTTDYRRPSANGDAASTPSAGKSKASGETSPSTAGSAS